MYSTVSSALWLYLIVVVRKFRLWFDWQTAQLPFFVQRAGDSGLPGWAWAPGLFDIHRLGITRQPLPIVNKPLHTGTHTHTHSPINTHTRARADVTAMLCCQFVCSFGFISFVFSAAGPCIARWAGAGARRGVSIGKANNDGNSLSRFPNRLGLTYSVMCRRSCYLFCIRKSRQQILIRNYKKSSQGL